MQSIDLFVISKGEGEWPNRAYVDLVNSPLFYPEAQNQEEYVAWLRANAGIEGAVEQALEEIADAISSGVFVRIVVPDRHSDFMGAAVVALVQEAMNA